MIYAVNTEQEQYLFSVVLQWRGAGFAGEVSDPCFVM
jgi:hypothetical protein